MNRIFFFLLMSLFCAQANAKTKKTIYVVVDGVPADYIERLKPTTIFDIAAKGTYGRAFTGGEVGAYSQTPTISAIGYMNILTGTWMNKHNVNGNNNLKPNYNYHSLFRIAKEQQKDYKTAIFSSWIDNRTVLIGENKPETNHLKIDYVFDGYELDTIQFPKKDKHLEIFDVDVMVAKQAAECIRTNAPDFSWVYLWYTDSASHLDGNGSFFDKYVNETDKLVRLIWEAVKYREKNFDEEWLVIITSDHGRDESGHNHGRQSDRERSVWISTNVKNVNPYFTQPNLSLVDLLPTICSYMNFIIPEDVKFEQDGVSFIGDCDIYDLRTMPYDNEVTLSWKSFNKNAEAVVYAATTNLFKEGGKDEWVKVGSVKTGENQYKVDLSQLPASKFYKFAVVTQNNTLTRWLQK